MNAVTTQTVIGALKAAGLHTSHKYPSRRGQKISAIRSCGLYSQLVNEWDKENGRTKVAVLAYWTAGYSHHEARALEMLPLAIEALAAKGLAVKEIGNGRYAVSRAA